LAANAQGFDPYKAYGSEPGKKNAFRVILNKITFTASGGYGRTFYNTQLQNYVLLTKNKQLYLSNNAPSGGNLSPGILNWLNAPTVNDNVTYNEQNFLISSDTTDLIFNGNSGGIPLNVLLHYEFDRFKIGFGAGLEYHQLPTMHSKNYRDQIGPYNPDPKGTLYTRLYGMVGARVWQWVDYLYFVDFHFGVTNYGPAFDQSALQKRFFFDLGFPVEKMLSEYFRIFIRPSIEYKSFSIDVPNAETLNFSQPTFNVQIGIRINYPDIPRCPIKSCQTQLKHIHGGKEFRGQPIYRKQNPKIGELYPTLIKYKGMNKRKRSGGY